MRLVSERQQLRASCPAVFRPPGEPGPDPHPPASLARRLGTWGEDPAPSLVSLLLTDACACKLLRSWGSGAVSRPGGRQSLRGAAGIPQSQQLGVTLGTRDLELVCPPPLPRLWVPCGPRGAPAVPCLGSGSGVPGAPVPAADVAADETLFGCWVGATVFSRRCRGRGS